MTQSILKKSNLFFIVHLVAKLNTETYLLRCCLNAPTQMWKDLISVLQKQCNKISCREVVNYCKQTSNILNTVGSL